MASDIHAMQHLCWSAGCTAHHGYRYRDSTTKCCTDTAFHRTVGIPDLLNVVVQLACPSDTGGQPQLAPALHHLCSTDFLHPPRARCHMPVSGSIPGRANTDRKRRIICKQNEARTWTGPLRRRTAHHRGRGWGAAPRHHHFQWRGPEHGCFAVDHVRRTPQPPWLFYTSTLTAVLKVLPTSFEHLTHAYELQSKLSPKLSILGAGQHGSARSRLVNTVAGSGFMPNKKMQYSIQYKIW